jgi:hypothetical protein
VRISPAGQIGSNYPEPDPQPEPGWELDCGVMTSLGGVISTSWNTPPTGFETTTKAGELVTLPVAQLG